MSKELGRTITHLPEIAKQKGKQVLVFSKHAVKPALYVVGTAGIVAGTISASLHLREYGEANEAIDRKVNEAFTKEVPKQLYELTQDNQLIIDEQARSLNASQLKKQLKKDLKAKNTNRAIIEIAIISLSIAAFLAPSVSTKK